MELIHPDTQQVAQCTRVATQHDVASSSTIPERKGRHEVGAPLRRRSFDTRHLPVIGTVVVLGLMLAVGMPFVILTGGIDLSVRAVLDLSAIVTASLLRAGWNVWLVMPAAVLAGSAIGLVLGLIIHCFKVQPFIATLAGMFFARGMCFVIAPELIPINNEGFVALTSWSLPIGAGGFRLTTAVVIALVVLAAAVFVLPYTRLGRTVYAIGGGEQLALMMGLPVARSKVLVYVVSGTCAGFGGLLFAMFSRSGYALTGVGMELDAIAAVVIGGTLLTGGSGLVLGSLLGVLVLGLIQTIITFEGTLSSWWTRIVIGVLLLIFVVLQRLLARKQT